MLGKITSPETVEHLMIVAHAASVGFLCSFF
jgi:hypothetical protein